MILAVKRAVYRWMFEPAEREAIILHTAVKETDYRVIIESACVNSPNELLIVKQAYQVRYKCSLEEDVASHITGDFRKGLSGEDSNELAGALRAAIRCIISPKKYLEKLLRSAVSNPGSEDVLTRVIVMHAEKDLKEIKEMFEKRANAALDAAIVKATHGDHKKFLLALLGN